VVVDSDDCFFEHLYGTHSENAQLLRCLRDSLLVKSKEGREIIRLYNQYNTLVISVMKEDPDFKNQVKNILNEWIPIIKQLLGNSIIKR
jgi:hypothetical protein